MIVIGIVVATIVAFVISFVFYAVAPSASTSRPDTTESQSERPAPWQILIELLRSAIIASLVAGLLIAAEWDGPTAGALLGLALWALPLVLLAGSVIWERVPVRRATLHAGDWLIKLIAIGAIVGAFA